MTDRIPAPCLATDRHVCLQVATAVNRMPTDDVDTSSAPEDASGVNPYVNHPDLDATRSGTSRGTGHVSLSSLGGTRGPAPFVPISTQMWHSGFTSIVSHLGGGASPGGGAEAAPEGKGSPMEAGRNFHESEEDSEEIAPDAPKWSTPGRSSGRMGAAAAKYAGKRATPASAPTPSAEALQRAVEDIRHTMASSIEASTGDAMRGGAPVVAVPPQPAAQEMFRKRFENSKRTV